MEERIDIISEVQNQSKKMELEILILDLIEIREEINLMKEKLNENFSNLKSQIKSINDNFKNIGRSRATIGNRFHDNF